MTTSQFTSTELSLIEKEANDCGFPSAQSFLEIEAGIERIHRLLQSGYFDRHLKSEEIEALRGKIKAPVAKHTFNGRPSGVESAYYIFEDESLYFSSNAQDEVWADAADFAAKIAEVKAENYSAIDWQLLALFIGHVSVEFSDLEKATEYAESAYWVVPFQMDSTEADSEFEDLFRVADSSESGLVHFARK